MNHNKKKTSAKFLEDLLYFKHFMKILFLPLHQGFVKQNRER